MDNDISWAKEVSLQRPPLTYSSRRERPSFSPAGRGLGDFSLQEKPGRNCGGAGEADEKGFKPHHEMLNGAEGEGIGGHMKTALLNWPSFPIPHTKTSSLKPEGR